MVFVSEQHCVIPSGALQYLILFGYFIGTGRLSLYVNFIFFQRLGGRGSLPAAPRGGGGHGQQEEVGRQKRPGRQPGRRAVQPHALPPLHGHVEEGGDGSLATSTQC